MIPIRLTACCLLLLTAAACASPAPAAPVGDFVETRWDRNRAFVPIYRLASFYGLSLEQPSHALIVLRSRWSLALIRTDSRELTVNGVRVWLHEGPRFVRGAWCLAREDVNEVIDPIFRSRDIWGLQPIQTVVLDPGHGGRDAGASGRRNVQEKRVALDIARRVRAHLADSGLRVRLTRDGDRFLSLDERVALAARWKADLFVSIHLNAATHEHARGVETFVVTAAGFPSTNTSDRERLTPVLHPGNRHGRASAAAGYRLQKSLLSATRANDRGLRRARFYVLKQAPCPAVLVECGFVSNHEEERLLLRAAHRDAIARGIADGIRRTAELSRSR
jgi:N-acetylmuramoyl-L-alanine amidase